jgi:hypothetical protein
VEKIAVFTAVVRRSKNAHFPRIWSLSVLLRSRQKTDRKGRARNLDDDQYDAYQELNHNQPSRLAAYTSYQCFKKKETTTYIDQRTRISRVFDPISLRSRQEIATGRARNRTTIDTTRTRSLTTTTTRLVAYTSYQ